MDPRNFGYDVRVQPNADRPYRLRAGLKTLSIVGKGITDVYLAFRFETKLTILVATNGVAGVKNLY